MAMAIVASTVEDKPLSISAPQAAGASGREARPTPRLISVVVPAFNEEAGLARLLARLRPVLEGLGIDWEVIFVDDGSSDGTRDTLKACTRATPVSRVVLSRNFGKEIAVAAGLAIPWATLSW